MSLQQYSNALQCNYVSLLFVQCTAATLTRAHRSMCQFRAMPATSSTSLLVLPACCQLCKQTKEAATSAAATTTFPFLYSAATLPMTSDRERTESRQARLDNLYVATATVATVYLNVLVCVFVVRVLCVLDFQYFTTSVVGPVLFCSVLLLRNCLVSYITQLWQHLQHKDNRTNKRQIDWHLPTLQFPHAPRSPHHHYLSLSDLTTAQAV